MFDSFVWAAMAGQPGGEGPSGVGTTMMLFLFIAIMYVMIFRPQMRKDKERKAMLETMKKGDKVLLAGGIIGQIVQMDGKVVKVKIADNTRVDVVRGGISMVLSGDEEIEDLPPQS